MLGTPIQQWPHEQNETELSVNCYYMYHYYSVHNTLTRMAGD